MSQNVLGVVNFDMLFTYVLAGWEGSAHDSRVLDDAKGKGLPMLPGKYYLGDAGYALSRMCLTPYRGVRYHLKEWEAGNRRPITKEELFNLRHSSLRNVIERTFGVLKKRFPLLTKMHSYSIHTQTQFVTIACMMHNFIRRNQLYDDEFNVADIADEIVYDDEDNEPENMANAENINQLKAWRNNMAQSMWDDYVQYNNINP